MVITIIIIITTIISKTTQTSREKPRGLGAEILALQRVRVLGNTNQSPKGQTLLGLGRPVLRTPLYPAGILGLSPGNPHPHWVTPIWETPGQEFWGLTQVQRTL